jgi:hypothetical protein
MLCALLASMAVAVAPAAAESGGGAKPPPFDGIMFFPSISGPSSPEEYSWRVTLGSSQRLVEVDETEAEVRYEDGTVSFMIFAELARDWVGTMVPTTLRVSEGDVLTLVVHHRQGNPAAGGAPFVYPVVPATEWEGPLVSERVMVPPDENEIAEEIRRAQDLTQNANPAVTITESPIATCAVPSLRGLSLKFAKARLRAADCAIGQVHLAAGATAGKGKVVKQFHPAGTQLAAGAPVAVKLGSR